MRAREERPANAIGKHVQRTPTLLDTRSLTLRSIGLAHPASKYPPFDRCTAREQGADHWPWPDDHSSALHTATVRHCSQIALQESRHGRHPVSAHSLQHGLVHSPVDQLHPLRSTIDVLFAPVAQYPRGSVGLGMVSSTSTTSASSDNHSRYSSLNTLPYFTCYSLMSA